MHVAVPAPEGVKTPPDEIVPPVAVHVTNELKAPVPETVAPQVDVCVVVMDAGDAATVIAMRCSLAYRSESKSVRLS